MHSKASLMVNKHHSEEPFFAWTLESFCITPTEKEKEEKAKQRIQLAKIKSQGHKEYILKAYARRGDAAAAALESPLYGDGRSLFCTSLPKRDGRAAYRVLCRTRPRKAIDYAAF